MACTLKNLFSSLNVRAAYRHLTVKTSRTKDRRIQNIHSVGSCHNNNALINPETIHLYKELVQSLLSFIMAAAHAGSSLSGNCIDLINKDDTWSMFLAFFKKVSYSGCTYTNKHFHKVRTGNREERYSCLPCHCFGKKGLTCSRRSYKQYTLGDTWLLHWYISVGISENPPLPTRSSFSS